MASSCITVQEKRLRPEKMGVLQLEPDQVEEQTRNLFTSSLNIESSGMICESN